MKRVLITFALLLAACGALLLLATQSKTNAADGYIIERDAEVAKDEPGPHNGGGPSTAYVFFDKAPNLKFSFRKRVLHAGAAIGYHLQETDEVYYMLSGTGKMIWSSLLA